MAWYYMRDGVQEGPVEQAAIAQLSRDQIIQPETMVWTEGMTDWQRYDAVAAGGGAAQATHACVECGKSFPEEDLLQYEKSWVCAACKPIFFQKVKEGVTPKGDLNYATVGSRFGALLLDGIILVAIAWIPTMLFFGASAVVASKTRGMVGGLFFMAMSYGFPVIYDTFFVGKFGATPGKMAARIKIVAPDGGPVSYWRAFGRHFAKFLSMIILYIGFFMAIWDEEKRALHDRICATRVVKA